MLSNSGITVLSCANKVVKVQLRKFVRSLYRILVCYSMINLMQKLVVKDGIVFGSSFCENQFISECRLFLF